MILHRLGAAAFLAAAVACASAPAPSDGSTPAAAPRRSSGDVLTADDLAADPSVANGDALAAVRRLRPAFLVIRGSGSVQNPNAGQVHVSINGGSLITLDNLSRYNTTSIAEIRYLNPTDAAQRFGAGANSGGVLLVKTK